MKAVIYVRVSSEDQVENTSLESQERICREFCRQKGMGIDRLFADRGESAKTSDRPQFLEMIRYATHTPGITSAVVYKLDRFARNQFDTAIFIRTLAVKGVTLLSATEQISEGMEGKIMRGVLSLLAEIDNDMRADRTKTSMRSLVEKGFWVHQAPLGYRSGRDVAGNPILVPDPHKGPIIRDLFEQIAEGRKGMRESLDDLTRLGFSTSGGRPLGVSALHRILRSPIYCGRIIGKITGGRTIKTAFEPLVSEDTFDQVQAILAGRSLIQRPKERLHTEYPLKGLILCGYCGAPLTASHSTGKQHVRYPYYHCYRHGCMKTRVNAGIVHDLFDKLLESVAIVSSKQMGFLKSILTWMANAHADAVDAEKACSEATLRALKSKQDKLLDALVSGIITDVQYRDKLKAFEGQMQQAQAALNLAIARKLAETGAKDGVLDLLRDPRSLWALLDVRKKLLFSKCLFPHGLIYRKGVGLVENRTKKENKRNFTPSQVCV